MGDPPLGGLGDSGRCPLHPRLRPSAIPERKTVTVSRDLALAHLCPAPQEPVELHLLQDEGVFWKPAVSWAIWGPGKADAARGAVGESDGNPKPTPFRSKRQRVQGRAPKGSLTSEDGASVPKHGGQTEFNHHPTTPIMVHWQTGSEVWLCSAAPVCGTWAKAWLHFLQITFPFKSLFALYRNVSFSS